MKNELLFLCSILPTVAAAQTTVNQPNVIYILADDLGYGDVSAMSAGSKIQTPNIDKLARQGMRFTDCHSSSSLSTPTRYGILTGRYNWRSPLQAGVTWSYSPPLIERERPTVATMLAKTGYATAVIGKWHLGLGWRQNSDNVGDVSYTELDFSPRDNGFDYSFVMPASLDIPPYVYIENGRFTAPVTDTIAAREGLGFYRKGPIAQDFVIEDALEKFTSQATTYIAQSASSQKPFFLYFPITAPHTPILPPEKFRGRSKIGDYGDFVLYVDDVVGRIAKAVVQAGLEQNTIIVFTSDNGCSPWADIAAMKACGHDPSGGLRGTKSDIYDGGHRVPFIVQWPGVVAENSLCDSPISLNSLYATLAQINGVELSESEAEDSFSILPALRGEPMAEQAVVHHSGDGYFALTIGDWKFLACPHSGGWSSPTLREVSAQDPEYQLYNMVSGRDERRNLSSTNQVKSAEMLERLTQIVGSGASRSGAVGQNDVEVVIFKNLKK